MNHTHVCVIIQCPYMRDDKLFMNGIHNSNNSNNNNNVTILYHSPETVFTFSRQSLGPCLGRSPVATAGTVAPVRLVR